MKAFIDVVKWWGIWSFGVHEIFYFSWPLFVIGPNTEIDLAEEDSFLTGDDSNSYNFCFHLKI